MALADDQLLPPARYFPVRKQPYRMAAGLSAFGSDFGNAERDRMYFQRDREWERYLRAKLAVRPERHRVLADDETQRAAHRSVLTWMARVLEREHPGLSKVHEPSYGALSALVQEDFAVVQRSEQANTVIAAFVSFPSGWRPERISGTGFKQIHAPVPNFAERDDAVASMVDSMVERGPYVRFVWTIAADEELDHHPEEGRRAGWRVDGRGWLRVERQVTVPFPDVAAALFLIRTYLYPFDSLTAEQRHTLATALEAMPATIAIYKGLGDDVRRIAARLLRNESH